MNHDKIENFKTTCSSFHEDKTKCEDNGCKFINVSDTCVGEFKGNCSSFKEETKCKLNKSRCKWKNGTCSKKTQ
jgi:hypothetical protein